MFVEDPDFEHDLFSSPAVRTLLRSTADDVARLAGALAREDSGHYRRTLEAIDVEPGRARVLSGDIAGHLIEFGGRKNIAQAPLRRAADSICDGFHEAPKP